MRTTHTLEEEMDKKSVVVVRGEARDKITGSSRGAAGGGGRSSSIEIGIETEIRVGFALSTQIVNGEKG